VILAAKEPPAKTSPRPDVAKCANHVVLVAMTPQFATEVASIERPALAAETLHYHHHGMTSRGRINR
jgi:hypothetical protein